MAPRKLLIFLFQAVTVGLALAFVVLVIKPDLIGGIRPVVKLMTSAAPAATVGTPPIVSFADAVTRSAPAIVSIQTAKLVTLPPNPFDQLFGGGGGGDPSQRLQTSVGSGVIVSPQGYILTNNHVIYGASAIRIQLTDGRIADARVIGTDPETDLAVLHVETPNLPAVVFGTPDRLRIGDIVLAIGNPFGVGQTVTMGIVSATGRNRLGISTFENFIQTDAAINPGNSGGALVNTAGELVGINTAIFSRSGGSQGIGFAIPADLATQTLEQLIEHGRVVRGWLGIEIRNLTPELAQAAGLQVLAGFVVTGVLRGGPAEQAGLMPGDIVTAIDGNTLEDIDAAMHRIVMLTPGERVKLTGHRGESRRQWDVVAAERPSQQAP